MRSSTSFSTGVVNTTDILTTNLNSEPMQTAFNVDITQDYSSHSSLTYNNPPDPFCYSYVPSMNAYFPIIDSNNPFITNTDTTNVQTYNGTYQSPIENNTAPIDNANFTHKLEINDELSSGEDDNEESENESSSDTSNTDESDDDSDNENSDNEDNNIVNPVVNPDQDVIVVNIDQVVNLDQDAIVNVTYYQQIFDNAVAQNDVASVAQFARFVDATHPLDPQDYFQFQVIHRAANNGDLNMLKALLEDNPNASILIEQQDSSYRTALMLAIEKKHTEIIFYLLSKNARTERILHSECFHEAIISDNEKLIIALIENFIRNAQLEDYALALQNDVPCINNQIEINANLNIHNGAQIKLAKVLNTPNAFDLTPLMQAAKHNRTNIVKYLIDQGANLDTAFSSSFDPNCKDNGKTALQFAAENKHIEATIALLEKGALVSSSGSAEYFALLFRTAYSLKNINIIITLLKAGCTEAIKKCDPKNSNPLTFIHQAIIDNDLDMVMALIEYGPKELLEQKDNYQTPLLSAAINDRKEIIAYLLRKGANPSASWKDPAKNNEAKTVLHYIFDNGDDKLIAGLLQQNADVITRILYDTKHEKSFLHRAAEIGNLTLFKVLVEQNPKINDQNRITWLDSLDGYKQTPLMYATAYGHEEIIKYLLQQKVDVNAKSRKDYTSLHNAYIKGHFKIVSLLVQNGANANLYSQSENKHSLPFLHQSVKDNNLDMVKALLENNPNAKDLLKHEDLAGNTPLSIAVIDGKFDILTYLLDKGANPDGFIGKMKEKKTLLQHACEKEDLKMIIALLQKGVDATLCSGIFPCLHQAIKDGKLEVIKTLIENTPSPKVLFDQRDSEGATPLLRAAQKGQPEIIAYLLEKGANPNAVFENPYQKNYSKNNKTALHIVYDQNKTDIAAKLVENGADITLSVDPTNHSMPILYHAIRKNNFEMVKALLESHPKLQAVIDHMDGEGETALMIAAMNGHTAILDYLLQKGANPNIITQHPTKNDFKDNGMTALSWAVHNHHIDVILTLLKHKSTQPIDLKQSWTWLCEAIEKGKLDLIEALFCNNPELKTTFENVDKNGYTLLFKAISSGRVEIVRYLLTQGANPNQVFKDKRSALYYAIASKNPKIISALIEKGADITQQSFDPLIPSSISFLHKAAQDGNLKMVEILLEDNPCLKKFIDHEDQYSETALLKAAAKGHTDVVIYLLKKGANPNVASKHPSNANHPSNGRTPLGWAFANGHMKVILILTPYSQPIDEIQGYILLCKASKEGRLDVIQALFDNNPNLKKLLDNQDENGETLLIKAITNHHHDIATYLLKQGANPNIISQKSGESALHLVFDKSMEMVTILVTMGADVTQLKNPKDPYSLSFLHHAVEAGDLTKVKALLETNPQRKIVIEKKDQLGQTPLFLAARHGNNHIVKYLEKKGAINDYQSIIKRSSHLCNELRLRGADETTCQKYSNRFQKLAFQFLESSKYTDSAESIALALLRIKLDYYKNMVPDYFNRKYFERAVRLSIVELPNWQQNIKLWQDKIDNIIDFLNEKASLISYLENEMIRIRNDKFNFLNDKVKTNNKLHAIQTQIDMLCAEEGGIDTPLKLQQVKVNLLHNKDYNQNRNRFFAPFASKSNRYLIDYTSSSDSDNEASFSRSNKRQTIQ